MGIGGWDIFIGLALVCLVVAWVFGENDPGNPDAYDGMSFEMVNGVVIVSSSLLSICAALVLNHMGWFGPSWRVVFIVLMPLLTWAVFRFNYARTTRRYERKKRTNSDDKRQS